MWLRARARAGGKWRHVTLPPVVMAAAGGAALVPAMPPAGLAVFLVPAFGLLGLALSRVHGRLARGGVVFVFALVFHTGLLYWLTEALLVDADSFAWALPLAVPGVPALLGLVMALPFVLLPGGGERSTLTRALVLAILWGAGEWLKGLVFPWGQAGHALAGSEYLSQTVAWTGVPAAGLVLVAVATAAGLDLAALPGRAGNGVLRALFRKSPGFLLACVLSGGLFAAGAIRLAGAQETTLPGVRAGIVQAAVPQRLRRSAADEHRNLLLHAELLRESQEQGITHWIWPEAVIPYPLGETPELLAELSAMAAAHGPLLSGGIARERTRDGNLLLYNSLYLVTGEGVAGRHDKVRLVPFGEYLPFRRLFTWLGVERAVAAGMVDFSPGKRGGLLSVPGLPALQGLICYEVVFPEEIRGDPELLLNVSNDGWFGRTGGPWQHLALARLRAIENGAAMIRATNSGISAIIDPYGRVVASLGLGQRGVLAGRIPAGLDGRTPYQVTGDLPFLLQELAGLLFLVVRQAGMRAFFASFRDRRTCRRHRGVICPGRGLFFSKIQGK